MPPVVTLAPPPLTVTNPKPVVFAVAIDVFRDRLRREEDEAKKALGHATAKRIVIEQLQALPFFDRIDFAADLADFYAEIDTRPE